MTRNFARNFRRQQNIAPLYKLCESVGYAAPWWPVTRFRGPQISGFVARSRVLDNSGVPSPSLRSLQQFPLSPVVPLADRFALSQIFYWPMHLPDHPGVTALPRRLPRGASYISCTEYNGASSGTRQVRRESGIETMAGFMYEKSLYNTYPRNKKTSYLEINICPNIAHKIIGINF